MLSLYGIAEVVQLLLDAGADKEAKDNNGNTALMHSIKNIKLNIVIFIFVRFTRGFMLKTVIKES